MKTLTITEEQMDYLLREFLKQYQGKFDHVSFDEAPNGYMVNFHQTAEQKIRQEEKEEPAKSSVSDDLLDALNPLSPISVFHDFGGGGGFGGFGGGSSGGGGAGGDW